MRRKIALAFLVLLMISTAGATSIDNEEVTIDLNNNHVAVDAEITSITTSTFSYVTSVPVNDVEGRLNGEPIECNVSEFQIGSDIQCEAPEKENVSLDLEFTATNLVESRNGYNIFQYSHSVYRPTDRYEMTVILPENADIVENTNRTEETIIPGTGEIGETDGRTSVTWEKQPRLGEILSFQTIYQVDSSENGLSPVYVLLAILASLGVAYIIVRMSDEEETIDLESDEEEVVDIIRDNGGEMLQKDVVSESEYSKAKISGVVSSLVDKEVVTKEKEGRSNKLVLKKMK